MTQEKQHGLKWGIARNRIGHCIGDGSNADLAQETRESVPQRYFADVVPSFHQILKSLEH
jgi:hypothetical protein